MSPIVRARKRTRLNVKLKRPRPAKIMPRAAMGGMPARLGIRLSGKMPIHVASTTSPMTQTRTAANLA